jgi:V/A-type H+-transporting ATPase subunit E
MELGKVEKLRQKIIGDAEGEAAKIVREGEAQAREIIEDAKAQIEKIVSDFEAKAKAEAKEHIRRQVSLRELEAKKAILAEKGKVIDQVFDRVLEELRRRDREGGYALTRELLLKAIDVGDEKIIVSPEDSKAIGSSFLKDLNKQIKAMGKSGGVTLSEETRDVKGGFILVRGRREINSRFETILSMIRDEVETEVAGILFRDGGASA